MTTYDLVGVGIGPFNLGLAALAAPLPELRARFFDARPRFDWHRGMLIEGTTLQVPFLADLVTGADPTSPLSFLAYVKSIGRLYQFAVRESAFVTRDQYNRYCQWVADRLPSLAFGTRVERVSFDEGAGVYRLDVAAGEHRSVVSARNVVVGVGTTPELPRVVPAPPPRGVTHSATYLDDRDALLRARSVLLVGSGQSAAEIFYDLLCRKPDELYLAWITRAERFAPMDDSKLALELASPDYVAHFQRLPGAARKRLLAGQDSLYRGINRELLARIYDALHDRTVAGPRSDVSLTPGVELVGVESTGRGLAVELAARDVGRRVRRRFDRVVCATGYGYRFPRCLAPIDPRLERDEVGALRLRPDGSVRGTAPGVYVHNAEPLAQGFTASDLSLGPYRNARILNAILGREHYAVETRTAFQTFGVPPGPEAETERPLPSTPFASLCP